MQALILALTLLSPGLTADGPTLRDPTGQALTLRGVNLGGWLEWQSWMGPMDASGTLRDANPGHNGYDFELRRLLTQRFGAAKAQELIDVYLDAWLTTRDLDNLKALGLNAVRLTLSYDALLNEDGTWRGDAFARADWLVKEAWARGLYTIVDLHAWLPPGADQNGGASGYWRSEPQRAETVAIWTRIAQHFAGNPAAAMYDLLNEPNNSQLKNQPGPKAGDVCELYDRLYQAIRAVDADHLIAMEGVWDWHSLRNPGPKGYRNVVYSFHWYHWGARTTAERNRGTDGDLKSVAEMQAVWPVPVLIGEFNLFGDRAAWRYALAQYAKAGLSWTLWSFKNKDRGGSSWGVFTAQGGRGLAEPNLATDDAETIAARWRAWGGDGVFKLNGLYRDLFGPVAP